MTQEESNQILKQKIAIWVRQKLAEAIVKRENPDGVYYTPSISGGRLTFEEGLQCDEYDIDFTPSESYQISEITWDNTPEKIDIKCSKEGKYKGAFHIQYMGPTEFLSELFNVTFSNP
jgi:hypothetical protein